MSEGNAAERPTRSRRVVRVALALAAVFAATPAWAVSKGHYARGRQTLAVALAEDGPHHYLVLTPECYDRMPLSQHYEDPKRTRNFYGHPSVVAAITDVAEAVRTAHPDAGRFPVGELSNLRGGKIPFHLSHQNGLDVDIGYLVRTGAPHPVKLCHDGPRFEVVVDGTWRVREELPLDLNWAMVSAFAARDDVRSIFVGGVIRRALDAWGRANAPRAEHQRTMKKLIATFCRAPKGVQMGTYRNNRCPHDDHVHVRFHCPADSPDCTERKRRVRTRS